MVELAENSYGIRFCVNGLFDVYIPVNSNRKEVNKKFMQAAAGCLT
jgi:hypothetical protein